MRQERVLSVNKSKDLHKTKPKSSILTMANIYLGGGGGGGGGKKKKKKTLLRVATLCGGVYRREGGRGPGPAV